MRERARTDLCGGGAIPVKLDNQYFAINQAGELWKAIMLSRQIAVHSPGKIKEPRMELLIVLE
jgi:predicted component of type VI protein secretion system